MDSCDLFTHITYVCFIKSDTMIWLLKCNEVILDDTLNLTSTKPQQNATKPEPHAYLLK